MREISLVKNLCFEFHGNITKNALVIGDADNDQKNELVCANLQGTLAIFKDSNKSCFACARNLGMITSCCIGNFTNNGKNHVAGINMEGWLYLFDIRSSYKSELNETDQLELEFENDPLSAQEENLVDKDNGKNLTGTELFPVYKQLMPANCKVLLIADLDGDGQNELIIGLTDRVLRTYRWIQVDQTSGKFVGIYKWEFADQIGAVSLNPSQHEKCLDIIVAQPGGTFAKLECNDKQALSSTDTSCSSYNNVPNSSKMIKESQSRDSPMIDEDNVKTEKINRLTPEYHQLNLSQMRNQHISTDVLGGISDGSNLNSLIAVATLDGTLMLVKKDEILWSLQLDQQLFALAKLDNNEISVTSKDGTITRQYFIACAWDGKTWIFNEAYDCMTFKFCEAVSAFTAGSFYLGGVSRSSLVYATFDNRIILYYDIAPDGIKPSYLLDELISNSHHTQYLEKLQMLAVKLGLIPTDESENIKTNRPLVKKLVYDILNNYDLI